MEGLLVCSGRKGIRERAMIRTSVGYLAGVAARAPVAVGWERRADFAERFECGAVTGSLVFCQCDLFLLAGLGVFDGNGERHDFVIEPARLLRSFRTLI